LVHAIAPVISNKEVNPGRSTISEFSIFTIGRSVLINHVYFGLTHIPGNEPPIIAPIVDTYRVRFDFPFPAAV
jgi:hypothetical protein